MFEPENLAFGAGSVEVASQLIHALAGAGDEVMYAWRSFEAYPILVQLAGATPCQVPLDADGKHDLPAMADAITDRTKLIFVCNPNNPTGTVVTHAEVEAFPARCRPRARGARRGIRALQRRRRLSRRARLLQALPERRGAAHLSRRHTASEGLRIGYAVAQPEGRRRTAQGRDSVRHERARARSAASLPSPLRSELQERVDVLVAERARVIEALRAAGCQVIDSQAKFVWIPAGETPARPSPMSSLLAVCPCAASRAMGCGFPSVLRTRTTRS